MRIAVLMLLLSLPVVGYTQTDEELRQAKEIRDKVQEINELIDILKKHYESRQIGEYVEENGVEFEVK